MDAAYQYDHITSQNYDRAQTPTQETSTSAAPGNGNDKNTDSSQSSSSAEQPRQGLQSEFQETLRSFSKSPWGATLGGFWGNVRKQGESYYRSSNTFYEEARKEVQELGADALKEIEGLRTKVANVDLSAVSGRNRSGTVKQGDVTGDEQTGETSTASGDKELQDSENLIARFRAEATKRLKEVQKAEDAADEALERFGNNIRNFLRDAVSISTPEHGQGTEMLFESKDASTGKRVIHTSRFDAQLHVIHTTLTSFSEDSKTDGEWEVFKKSFDIEKKTTDIATDLEKYPELRKSMEKLVPETVEYKDFWSRYYFLRHVVELQEKKRREMLKASANAQEEVGWDEDSDSESEITKARDTPKLGVHKNNGSTSTLQPNSATQPLELAEARRSHDEKSVADSDASYDLVSGTTTGGPGSPRESKGKADDSDEEDWE